MQSKASGAKGSGAGVAAFLALIAGCAYGVGGPISQFAVGAGFTVPQVVFAQFLVAFTILGILVLVKYRPHMTRKEVLQLFVLGFLSSVSSVAYYLAIDILSVSAAVAMQFQYVWMAVVIQSVVGRCLPGKWNVIAAIMILFGSVFGSGLADEIMAGAFTMDPIGFVYALVCAVFYAVFIYFNSRVAVNHHAVSRSFVEVCGGFVMAIIVITANGQMHFDLVAALPWGFLMGMMMSIVPVLFIIIAASRLQGGIVAVLTSSELPMAVIAGFFMLGEKVTPFIVFGVIVILAAIALSQLDEREAKNSEGRAELSAS